ncbi:hypothetical protein MRX96_052326 [Rhipicephalus microplus]
MTADVHWTRPTAQRSLEVAKHSSSSVQRKANKTLEVALHRGLVFIAAKKRTTSVPLSLPAFGRRRRRLSRLMHQVPAEALYVPIDACVAPTLRQHRRRTTSMLVQRARFLGSVTFCDR